MKQNDLVFDRESFSTILKGAQFDIDEQSISNLWIYFEELILWNVKKRLMGYNQEQLLVEGIFDSLSLLPYLKETTWVDVGTGAGLPGMILAIVRPDWVVHLVDSNHKKTSFLWYIKAKLGLTQVFIHSERIEQMSIAEMRFGVLAKAFAPVDRFLNLIEPLCVQKQATVYAMKGTEYQQELKDWSKQTKGSRWILKDEILIHVPRLEVPRHLLIFDQLSN